MEKTFIITTFQSHEFHQKFEEVAKPYNGNPKPLDNILDMLKGPPLSCKTAVFEYDYVDQDYLDEFSAFYSKSFKSYPSRCVRILFFDKDLTGREPLEIHAERDSFLGYMVLRPTDLQRVGRTLLRPPIQDGNSEFIHCVAPFRTHICGDCFVVSAMPFIQQDTQVGACAQASLWMLARYMSRLPRTLQTSCTLRIEIRESLLRKYSRNPHHFSIFSCKHIHTSDPNGTNLRVI